MFFMFFLFFAFPSCLRRHFARSFLDRWVDSKEEAKAFFAGGRGLVQFKLELTPNKAKPFELPTVTRDALIGRL